MNIFASLAQGVFGIIAKPIEEWQKRKTLKQEQLFELDKMEQSIKLTALTTKLEMLKNGQQIDYNLDLLATKNMEKSWKDEFLLIIFIAPMILAFTPYSTYALKGFSIITKMPYWYVALIVGMVVVIYGMRSMLKDYIQNKNLFKKE